MKAIVLGAGRGTRLFPITQFTNKMLLPLYNKTVLNQVVEQIVALEITKAALVVREEELNWWQSRVVEFVKDLPLNLSVIAEDKWATKGMAGAIYAARDFVGDDNFVVIPGDNAFSGSLKKTIGTFESGALVHRTHVDDPTRYGVGVFDRDKMIDIVEKPAIPPSNWALVSPHAFDSRAFGIIEKLQPSARGEYEITDLCRVYLGQGELAYPELDGRIFDIGTFDSLLEAQNYFAAQQKKSE